MYVQTKFVIFSTPFHYLQIKRNNGQFDFFFIILTYTTFISSTGWWKQNGREGKHVIMGMEEGEEEKRGNKEWGIVKKKGGGISDCEMEDE